MKKNKLVAPVLKWVGGKRQLLDTLTPLLPKRITTYCEPFVVGGAVLFDVLSKFQPTEILINDINPELTNCYAQVKTNVNDVIALLSCWQLEYLESSTEKRKEIFYTKRERFNTLIQSTGVRCLSANQALCGSATALLPTTTLRATTIRQDKLGVCIEEINKHVHLRAPRIPNAENR